MPTTSSAVGGADLVSNSSGSPTSTSTIGSPYTTSSTSSSVSTSLTTMSPTLVSTTSSESQPEKSTTPAGVSAGTVAGAVVGAALFAAIMGVIGTWLFMRSRQIRKSRRRSHKGQDSEKPLHPQRGRSSTSTPVDNVRLWENHLPQPVDDSSLRRQVKTLFHQIELHVENFYCDRQNPGQSAADVQSGLGGFESDELPAPIFTLLQQTSKQTALIKHSLAKCITSNISASEMRHTSFLPAEYAALILALNTNTPQNHKAGTAEAYSYWRVLTSYLRPHNMDDRDEAVVSPEQDSVIQSAAVNFSRAFEPWANSSQASSARIQNLVAIMRHAAQLGLVLFAQPAEFQYIWKNAGDRSSRGSMQRRIVVTPGLMKVSDDRARRLERGFVIIEPATVDV